MTEINDKFTPLLDAAEATIDQIDDALSRARAAHEVLAAHVDDRRCSKLRPHYPTPEQHVGLDIAAHWARARARVTAPNDDWLDEYPRPETFDHRGEECGTPLVTLTLRCRSEWRINVRAGAPLTARRRAPGRIWELTGDEIVAITHAIKSRGFNVVNWWRHDDGVGFEVTVDSSAMPKGAND